MRNRIAHLAEQCSGIGEPLANRPRFTNVRSLESVGPMDNDNCGAEPLGAIIEQLLEAYSRRFPQLTVQVVETPAGCLP